MKTEEKAVRKYRKSKVCSAKEKCRAVLALWSGKRTPSGLCGEFGVNWGIVRSWETRAMEGMIRALDPGWKDVERGGIRLGTRVEELLEKTVNVQLEEEKTVAQN